MGIKVRQTRWELQQEDASKSFYSLTIFIKCFAELFAISYWDTRKLKLFTELKRNRLSSSITERREVIFHRIQICWAGEGLWGGGGFKAWVSVCLIKGPLIFLLFYNRKKGTGV